MLRTVIVLACLVTGGAAAQEAQNDGPYLRFGAGATFASNWEENIEPRDDAATCLAIGCNPDMSITGFDNSLTFGAALGFDYADGIRTELEYRYANIDVSSHRVFEQGIDVTSPSQNGDAFGEVAAHLLFTNFYFDFYNKSAFTPFVGGGVGGAFVTNIAGDHDAALALQARAGVSYDLGTNFFLDTEVIYTRSNRLNFDANAATGAPAIAGDRLEATSVMASFRRQF